MLPRLLAAALLASGLLGAAARAGSLDRFEHDARSGHRGSDGNGELIESCLDNPEVAAVLLYGVAYGGIASWERQNADQADAAALDSTPREWGEGLIPILRLDLDHQWVNPDITAVRTEGEAGYGPFAVQVAVTRFDEHHPDDALTLVRAHGLYRMSFGDTLEVDLGFGELFMDGNAETERFSFTMPVRFHLFPGTGVEFKPAWSDRIEEYSLGVLAGGKFASLTAGYRWLRSPDESLDGPYAGLSVHF